MSNDGLILLRHQFPNIIRKKRKIEMQDKQTKAHLQVSNPIQAASEIFYNPRAVFEALSVRDNWSWIPFLLLGIILFLPPYLYFGVVNFDWWLDTAIMPSMANLSPAEQENRLAMYGASQTQITSAIMPAVSLIIVYAIKAFYFSMMTKNDEKSIHGFTDWYGATLWMAMPMLVSSLVSLVLLTFQEPGAEISAAILAPLSLAFILGTDMASPWFNLLTIVSIDSIWLIFLAYVCVRTWTNFSQTRAAVVALIPAIFAWSLGIATAIFMQGQMA
jgi:hypothetical protein